jgi:hypothetical protein
LYSNANEELLNEAIRSECYAQEMSTARTPANTGEPSSSFPSFDNPDFCLETHHSSRSVTRRLEAPVVFPLYFNQTTTDARVLHP